jgi:hypothetical protein
MELSRYVMADFKLFSIFLLVVIVSTRFGTLIPASPFLLFRQTRMLSILLFGDEEDS